MEEVVSFFKEKRHQKRKPNYIESHDLFLSFPLGGVGYCKAYPVPTIYNDPAIALLFNTNTTKRKAPRSQSLG